MVDAEQQEAAEEQSTALKVPSTLKALIEGLIFAAEEPLTVQQIRTIYQGDSRGENQRQLEGDAVRKTVETLNKEYKEADRPYRILQVAGGYQFATVPEYAAWIGKLYREQGRRKLSQSGIESLAIIAYKQPITKGEVEKIRGVNCDYVLKTLLEKELVTIVGRAESVGRPLLYGTTRDFLKHFGLNDITDLPRPREIEEILGESQFETERRMLEAQAGAEAMKKEAEDFKSRLPHIPKKKAELERSVEIVPRRRSREIRIVPGSAQRELETAGQEAIEFKPVEPIEVIQDVPEEVVAATPEQIEQPSPDVVEPESEVPEQPQETVEGTDGQPRPRWRSWKEKIQGFIRKLFA